MLTCDFGIFEKIITPAIRLLTAPPDFMTPEFANFSIIVLFLEAIFETFVFMLVIMLDNKV